MRDDVDDVNNYFTSVVCDSTYSRQAVLSDLHSQLNADDATPAVRLKLITLILRSWLFCLKLLKQQLGVMIFHIGFIMIVLLNCLMS